MSEHFTRISSAYRDLRTTDEAPILHIRDAVSDFESLDAVDIGCGAGRYDLLLFRHLPGLRLTCVDVSQAMLTELSDYLTEQGIRNFETVVARIEDFNPGAGMFDCVFTFNAVHHFDFATFLKRSGELLRAGGRIFVYTRTPQQNARSIWGRYFPEFSERETRLYTQVQMEKWVGEADTLELLDITNFRYERCASLDRLLTQARDKHYSTFSLYAPEDFRSASNIFEQRVSADFPDTRRIEWHDENIMLEIGRAGSANGT
jgi:SAM-dependent methyltransferase